MKTMRFLIVTFFIATFSGIVSAQSIEYVGIEAPLDGPSMVKYVFNPEHVANEMIEAWTCSEDIPLLRLYGILRSVGMEALDTQRGQLLPEPEEGEPSVVLTLFGGNNCEMTRNEVADDDAGDTYEEIDFKSRDGKPFSVLIMNVMGFDDESYNFGNNMDSSIRVAYSESKKRDDVLASLLEITGFKYDSEEEIYAGKVEGEIDYGTVITTIDEDETGLYWIEISSML